MDGPSRSGAEDLRQLSRGSIAQGALGMRLGPLNRSPTRSVPPGGRQLDGNLVTKRISGLKNSFTEARRSQDRRTVMVLQSSGRRWTAS